MLTRASRDGRASGARVEMGPIASVVRPRAGRELSLVGPSLRALAARRQRCAHCRRTPLVGERIFFYGERMVCALCRHLRREPPGREDFVHAGERGRTVKARPVA